MYITTKELIKELQDQGWTVDQTSQGHYRATPPDPDKQIVHMGGDSGDYRAVRNNIARLKKSGFNPPWDEPSNLENDMSTESEDRSMSLDDLEVVLELYSDVRELDMKYAQPATQLLFTKEEDGRWLVTVPTEYLISEGEFGKGRSPGDACRSLFRSLKEVIQAQIQKLQELDARLSA